MAVDPQPSFPALEERVLERWRERDVFARSISQRDGAQPWVFYEGPPTANGRPGAHHVLSRVFKDVFPRFKTMRGHRVERQGGWDCHGLPVEIAVEQELGISTKQEIEAYGIAEFNQRCRESVFTFLEDWDRLTERIGFWVDLDGAYRTLDTTYVESVWWALQRIHEQGLLYEGHRVVPYCPRCGTALSSHEVAQGYKDVVDPSVYVRFPVADRDEDLLVWTTTPWTLVSNAAVAVHPELTYVRTTDDSDPAHPRTVVLAEALVERVLGAEAVDRITERFAGATLVGTRYEPPFAFIGASEYGEKGHTVLAADFVTATDGTGLVHTAIAFGEDDFQLGQREGLAVVNPVKLDGTYDERIGPYAGRFVKEADHDLVEDLRARGRLLRSEDFEHAYPHCWRCGTPLLYYAKPSWYIATSTLRDRLLARNEEIGWHPEHVKHGRFGDWLAGNVDWALSRERYWGTPLPVWRCDDDGCEALHVVGSLSELHERSGVELDDPHRPFVDDVGWDCTAEGCDGRMVRVPEVIDVWFDSGAMPFAQHGAPHLPGSWERFEQRFPADYICEALDQTRGWFYSLHAIGALLFDSVAYRDVVCLGLITDADGQKMSKSKGNVVSPWSVLEQHGADAFRWYLFTAKQPWDGYRFSQEAIGEGVRGFLRQLWNVHVFADTYGVEEGVDGGVTELDRWALSRLGATVEEVTAGLEAFDATNAGRAIAAWVDDLSNWYVRRSRRRFWDGDATAVATLRECLRVTAQLLAPFCPFVADELWEQLREGAEPDSVHLCDWPAAPARDEALEAAMATARETVRLGLGARAAAKVRVRQPLRAAVVVAAGAEREAVERLSDVIADELNVKELRFVDRADELGQYDVRPNLPVLGPRFGRAIPQLRAALEALDPDHVASALRDGRPIGVSVEGHDHRLTADELLLSLKPLDGYEVEREGAHAVALELALDDDLRREGLVRDVVRRVQDARKGAGLEVSDRIALQVGGDETVLEAVRSFEGYVREETLATSLELGEVDGDAEVQRLDGRELRLALSRA